MNYISAERKLIEKRIARYADKRRSGWRRETLYGGLIAALALMGAATARAATITVGTLTDASATGSCSLRDAITTANGTGVSGSGCTSTTDTSNTIQFSLTGTILLNSLLPEIANTSPGSLTITGPTTSPGITIDGADNFRGLMVDSGATLNVANLTIADARAEGNEGGLGGGILNNGTLTVSNSTFSGNLGFNVGGGIFNQGTLTITNSTFSGNTAGEGGALANNGTLTVTNSTFSDNVTFGGRPNNTIENSGTATFKGTIMTKSGLGNCSDNPVIDGGYNISNDLSCGFTKTGTANNGSNVDPDLNSAGLAENGGPTETIALQSSSPAIAAIPVALCTDQATPPNPLTTDQRGYVRPSPAHTAACDIGAYEDNSTLPCVTLGSALGFALESVGGDVTTGVNASIGKGSTPAGSVGGLDVTLGNSSGVGQNAISSSSALVLGTNTKVGGACVTGGSRINAGSATRCGSTDTTGTNPLLATFSESGTDASTFETAVINATPTQSIGGFTLAATGRRTLTDTVNGGFNLIRINGSVVLNNSSSLTLAGAAGDTVVVDINGDLSLGTNSRIQLSGLLPSQVVVAVRDDLNWGYSSLINGTLLALDSACPTGNNDIVNGAAICGRRATFGSSLQIRFSPATNVCVP